MTMNQGVTPQAGPGHSPEGGAAGSTASPAKLSVPNAKTVVEMASVLRGNVASQRVTDAADINFRELAIAAICHTQDNNLEVREALSDLFEASRVHDPDDWTGEPAMCRARDALAKARGQ